MKTRIALLLGAILTLTPASTLGQAPAEPSPSVVDRELVTALCAAAAADESEQRACASAVEAALANMRQATQGEPSLLDQAQSLIDETAAAVDDAIGQVREIDLQAAIDDAVRRAQEFELDIDIDVQGAIDEAIAAIEGLDLGAEVDVQAALEQAVGDVLAAAGDVDLGTALDDALAEARSAIQGTDLQTTLDDAVAALEDGVDEARRVVAAAQAWAQENTDAVCRGGSISLGTTVGVAVFALTGVEWLGLQAFRATERFTNGVCGDVTG